MISTHTIEDALYGWAHAVLPSVPVIWYHQNAPRPTVPYVALHLTTINSVGVDAHLFPGTDGKVEVVGNRDLILLVQGIGNASMDFLETLKLSLEKPTVQFALRQSGIVFVDRMAEECISELVDSRWEERNLLDLKFRFAQTDKDDPGYFTKVQGDYIFKGVDLQTIVDIPISIP